MLTSVVYAAILSLLFMALSYHVIRLSWQHKISLGHGNNSSLESAIATQENASEYIPIGLILLFALEYNQASLWLVHVLGIALLSGRLLHAYGMFKKFKARVLGMQITIYSIVALCFFNLFQLIYQFTL